MGNFLVYLGSFGLSFVSQAGGMFLLLVTTLSLTFKPPYRVRHLFKQMEFVGVNSLIVVVLTALFSGMVIAFQSYRALSKFGGESLLGGLVALSMVRELGPVLTSLMVTARAGSAMAAELGTMRVTEQIDALQVMAVHPVHYLVVPRFWAAVLMVPLLTVIADAVGIAGGYLVGVMLLKVDAGIFVERMRDMVEWIDISSGIYKAFVFGGLLALIGCYKGYNASGGAEGVGRATTEAVVIASVAILVGDYILTSLLF
ncbi:MAG: ABC transporter permease [Thermodesulfatator sp.]|nr:MAG: ABC transporter permease [Thermodesulfatator sp.]